MASAAYTKTQALRELRALADPSVRAKMETFGVRVKQAQGIPTPRLHRLAKQIGRNHALADQLWRSGIHEAKILAALIGEPPKVTAAQMDQWALGCDSWDEVDASCCYLFVFAAPAWRKTIEWSRRKEEYVKRAAFALMAYLAYRDKPAADARFLRLLTIIRRESRDDRGYVKKAVNWALRNIGKRNVALNRAAIRTAKQIRTLDSKTAKWIAADALRELTGAAVQRRLRRRKRRL
ncbi:MAG TPA: DNA alkylation repair protein [Candidatus Dormibacteraeota bacterium]|nr:DNA alkylation repair protein [Candidatus Dormibacteraeota bacterium]